MNMQLLQISEPEEKNIEPSNLKAIGIDLGTTNSVVACVVNGRPEILGPIQPSIHEGIMSIKRLMGSNDKVANLTPEEVSAEILIKLKSQAEDFLKEKITKAVVTVPAHFDEGARNATKLAAKLAGLEVLRLINEPTSAAIAYGLDHNAEGTYLIYDLGGGTFDVSILKMQQGVFQVISTDGDNKLGGDDIDQEIARHLGIKDGILLARQAKEYLSENNFWKSNDLVLSRQELENIARPFVQKTIEIVKQTLTESGCTIDEIKELVLVGGSTKMPLVKQEIAKQLKKPLDEINPDIVVALGAAIQADSLLNGSENLLIDVTALSLGLEVMGGINERIISKNTPIPAMVTKYFTTHEDGQNGIIFHIVQGEREMAKDCRSLARFELKGIPPMKASKPKIAVSFIIDTDGLLTVKAEEETSGIKQEIEIKPTYGLNVEEVEKMILKSYKYAAEDIESKLISEEKLKLQKNIACISEAIAKDTLLLLKNEKNIILSSLEIAKSNLSSNDPAILQKANKELEEASSAFLQRRLNWQLKQVLQGKRTEEISKKL